MRLAPMTMLVSLFALTGCSLLHSNIKGGFACAAPKGTCAPSLRIDDAAIREIAGEDDHTSDREAAIADGQTDLDRSGHDKSGPRAAKKREWSFARGSRPALKVVYPAWRDGSGHLHPRTTAFAPVDLPPAAAPGADPLDGRRLGSADSASLLAIAEMAPEIAAASAPPQAAEGAARTGAAKSPEPEVHAGSNAASPIDAIKDQVKAILSEAAHPAASTPASKPGDVPAKPGASFPPAGN